LETTHSLKTARKAADVLAKVAVGLVANTDLDLCTVLTFIYQLTIEASESTVDKRFARNFVILVPDFRCKILAHDN
jgi:hypothetical protein